ncbi:MAG: DUF1573 domain-containing protein [Ignavibacteria bacterium]|nr:DUF1573 domain-containing protein [Ignavibacteria bacterium]
MKTIFFLICLLFGSIQALNQPADIIIRPGEPIAYFSPDEEGVVMDVMVLNKGGETLAIREVKSSCFCASAIVNNPTIRPMGKGKLKLQVSTARMKEDSLTRVDFTILSNAKDSAFSIPLYLVNKKFLKDTKEH